MGWVLSEKEHPKVCGLSSEYDRWNPSPVAISLGGRRKEEMRREGRGGARKGKERNSFLMASDTQGSVSIIRTGCVLGAFDFSGCGSAYWLSMMKEASQEQ